MSIIFCGTQMGQWSLLFTEMPKLFQHVVQW